MEGEAQVETQTETPAQEAVVEQVETEKPVEKEKPEGFDKVEFTPEQLARVNRIYGNMKRYESDARELREINSKLIETVSQVQQEQSKVVNHLQIKDYESAENKLKEEARQAYARGDVDNWMSATQKMAEITVKKSLSESAPRQPQQQPQRQPQQVSPEDAIQLATQKGDVSPEEANIYRAWVNETDAQGNLKRPWINPNDVRNTTAAFEGRAVFANPSFQNKSFAERLREIDKRMGMQTSQQGNSVMGAGNLTGGQKTNKVAVTDYEARIAVRTKFGGPKAKSDDDHVEAWRQAKIKSQKGGRK